MAARRLNPVETSTFQLVIAFAFLFDIARAQNTTDPFEGRAINSIFQRWGISAPVGWNISGELCTGDAINQIAIDDLNPGIKCDCRNSTCHITALRVYALDIAGTLPDELWNFTFLTNLNLAQNYLTGTIPASIGNLVRMQYLSLGINALSGELPSELGRLTDLRSLAVSTNNFSGPLPRELGSLSRLNQLYIDSAGLSGPIPGTFASLVNMEIMWALDNGFTGQIPDFIGNWSSLGVLRFEGNSFQGPIPPSFSNLTSLTDLRISDVLNGSSSLDFLRNMNSLTTLILRNNNISSSIPSFLGQLQNLTHLDMSFNNLTGRIPVSLFNLSSLTHLFLGSNMLVGELPAQKLWNLRNIDLSYNELSGGFPSWIRAQNLQINLVANNFVINSSIDGVLPYGLHCLQRNFPCNRGLPIYSSFAVNCGGPQINSSDGIVYERDTAHLIPTSYFMTGTNRWAVSNVGLPSGNPNPLNRRYSSSQFSNTLDPELFETSRISAGSLRYYGLGLENGNYTVRLHFAEILIESTRTWRSLGRRVFDIYIQGNRERQDFDIQREAGGASFRAVMVEFRAQVMNNFLEIHLFWAGKGTCCVPEHQGSYGPIVSAISATRDFVPNGSNNTPGMNWSRPGSIVGVVVAVGVASVLFLAAICYVFQKRKMQRNIVDDELMGIDARPSTYTYAELRAATNDFSHANKLGEGGFGTVYKGTLGDGRLVAVKQLSVASHQGKSQFVAEIASISAVQHRNLVKLYGCCIEGTRRLLVYEYLVNRSLDQLLFGVGDESIHLDWPTRYDICLGIARGLSYLHEESRVRIVHRDVKASNILLDSDLIPKISDFGLAKLYDDKMTHISTRIAGTIGYLAPEYAMRGHLTEKADIFSFGVVALEIISGRPNSDSTLEDDKIYLLEWAWNLVENNKEIELVDPTLSNYNENEVKRIIAVGLLCTQASPGLRPSMSRVVAMLSGDLEVASVTSRPAYLTDCKFSDATTFATYPDSSNSSTDVVSHVNTEYSTSSTMLSPVNPARPLLYD